jgi:hypothetical protein
VPLKGARLSSGARNFGPLDGSLRLRQNQCQGGHLLDSKVFGTFPGWGACTRAPQAMSRTNVGVFPDGESNRAGLPRPGVCKVLSSFDAVLPHHFWGTHCHEDLESQTAEWRRTESLKQLAIGNYSPRNGLAYSRS